MKKRADGRYQAKVTLPNGKVKFVYGKTKKEVIEKRDALKLSYSLGATNIDNKITVAEWANIWWDTAKKGKTGLSSQENYLSAMNNYIFPHLGELKLIEVRLIHVQDLLNAMGKAGRSMSLQKKVLITLNGIFNYAIQNGLVTGNPAQFAKLYEVPIKEVTALTPAQVDELLELCSGWPRTRKSTRADRAELAIHMGLYLGLRRGEIVAAQWGDIDKDCQTIHITRNAELVYNQPKNKDPKTVSGERYIPIPDKLFGMLTNTKKTSLYIAPSAKDTQMSKTAFRRLIEPIQQELSFDFTFHQLRHTYATLLEKTGVSPKMCQYLLGHASEFTTKKIYTHIQPDYILAVAGAINKLENFSR